MSTMNDRTPRQPPAPRAAWTDSTGTEPAVPAPPDDGSLVLPLRAIPWAVPLFAVMLLLMTGVVWAGLLWRY